MIILGIDPGLATTGYALIQKQTQKPLRALEWGVIETKKSENFSMRLHTIARDLETLVRRFRPQLAVVESIFFAKNVKTAINVSHARGVILLTLTRQKVKIVELTPLQMKSQITGYGSAPKYQVQTMVRQHLKLKTLPHPDDAADALALAICGSIKQ